MSEADVLAERTRHWALALTAMPSVTGTAGEAEFAGRLMQLLEASPAFSGKDARAAELMMWPPLIAMSSPAGIGATAMRPRPWMALTVPLRALGVM